jgi:hypothetical protein
MDVDLFMNCDVPPFKPIRYIMRNGEKYIYIKHSDVYIYMYMYRCV